VSYQTQGQLSGDPDFQGRVRSCCIQQADVFKDDARLNFVALAQSILRQDGDKQFAFFGITAASPGLSDTVDNGDGTIDQTKIADEDILASVQNEWPTVAALYFNDDGTPIA
jgi:hypothetical protein